jgi:hypothetical protein
MAGLEQEMVASYEVTITGIKRTRSELAKLSAAISSLRAGSYGMNGGHVTGAGNFGGGDIFVTKMDDLEGRIQTVASKAMLAGMDFGKNVQIVTLRAAVTATGAARGGNPGRDKTGAMIGAIKRNVEMSSTIGDRTITGWHGWAEGRDDYFSFQEQGTKKSGGGLAKGSIPRKRQGTKGGGGGVPAANSLGAAIVPTREKLKADLKAMKK